MRTSKQSPREKGIGSGLIKLTGINLELSSACNLNCPRCFRNTYLNGGKDEFLSLALLDKILPELKFLETIDLTGWGEPLLHPEFSRILRKIRKHFSGQLSFTTNGILLDQSKIEAILENGVNIICFSLDAGTASGFLKVRGGYWRELEEALKNLVREKQRQGRGFPKIYASFLLEQSRLKELFPFAQKMKELKIDGIILQQRTGVFNEEELKELTFSGYYDTEFKEAEFKSRLEELKRMLEGKMELIGPEEIFSELKGGCGAFPLGHLFLKAIGEVAPCCALGYPVVLLNRQRQLHRHKALILGDLRENSLKEIWEGEKAVSFREEMLSKGFAQACGDCIGLYLRKAE